MSNQVWVLLRGLIREQRHWESFPALLAGHMPGARIVVVDLPGNGVHCREPSPYRMRGMVEAVRLDLRQQGVIGPVSVLALSLGAMTALEWMSAYPQDVERAVLINTSLRAFSPLWHRLRPQNYGPIARELLFGSNALQRERLILGITTNLLPDRELYAQRWAAYTAERPISRRNALVQLFAAARYRQPAHPPRCPVLLLNGQGDRLVDPRCSERLAIAYGIPLEKHATAGHDLALDAPIWLAERVAEFAKRTVRS